MKLRLANSAMTLVMLAIFAALVFVASGYPANARFMPFVIGIPAIALCLLQLVLDARQPPAGREAAAAPGVPNVGPEVPTEMVPPVEPAEGALSRRETLRREVVLWSWFLALVGGALLFGFWVTIPIFLAAFLRLQAAAGWGLALALSGAATAMLYLGLEHAFQLELHRGFVTEYLRDRMGTRP